MRLRFLSRLTPRSWGSWIIMAALIGCFALSPKSATALDFGWGDLSLSVNTTVSYGLSYRVEGPDSRIIGIANGGTANSVNGDNGNLNYDKGIFSNAAKLTAEIDLNYNNFGIFARGFGFYDYENEQGERERTELSEAAKERVGSRVELLDAFAWASVELGSVPIDVRVGRQVVSWGESTFIQGGINAINPVDVSALRVPGAELREALLPVSLAWLSVSPTPNTTIEAVYQFQWEETQIDPSGSYFSTSDFAGEGGERVMLGFGRVPDTLPAGPMPPPIGPVGAVVQRSPDVEAGDDGQYGAAIRFFLESLGGMEVGFYHLNYHSRLPLINARTGSLAGLLGGDYAGSGAYFLSYPEDIRLFGVSYNATLGTSGVALQGEVVYRENVPLQIDDVELLYATLSPLAAVGSPVGQLLASTNQIGAFGFEQEIQGYILKDTVQFQTTLTRAFGPVAGSDQAILLWEGAVTDVRGMPRKEDLRLEAAGTYTSGNPIHTAAGVQPATVEQRHFPDQTSWGYRLAGRLDFNNAIGAVNLSPSFSFQHDVDGVSPGPGGNFIEGRLGLTLGLKATYQNALEFGLSYTDFSGAGKFNLIHDRDFLSFNVKYSI